MSRALLVAVVAGVAAALSAGALAAGPPPAAAASRGASAELACRAAPPVARSIVHHVAISTDDMPAGMSEPVALPAPCLSTTAAGSLAVLVDKRHPLSPRDYRPSDLRRVALPGGFLLRAPAAAALERLSAAAHRAGHGTLGVASAFRSYGFQKSLYSRYVGAKGPVWADRASARPGYSEHQTGLAVDVVACTPACGTIDGFGASGTGRWVAANAWLLWISMLRGSLPRDVRAFGTRPATRPPAAPSPQVARR